MRIRFAPNMFEAMTLIVDIVLLVVANLLTLLFYFNGNYSVTQVLVTYYIQTVLITIFYYKRIRKLHILYVSNAFRNNSLIQKVLTVNNRTAKEQFLFILTIFCPLAFLLYVFSTYILRELITNFGVVNLKTVTIASLLFLIHHMVSYLITIKEYRAGYIKVARLPYQKLLVRVATVVAVTLVGLSSYQSGEFNSLFVFFMIVKTFLDVLLSGSLYLFKSVRFTG